MTVATCRKTSVKDALVNSAFTAAVLLLIPALAIFGLMFQFLFVLAIPAVLLLVLAVPAIRRALTPRMPEAEVPLEATAEAPAVSAVPARTKIRNVVVGVAVTGACLLALPLLAVFGLTFQILFVVAVPAAILLALFIPQARRKLLGGQVRMRKVRGLSVREDVSHHPNHCWTLTATPRRWVLGVDDFSQRVLGTVDSVVLPDKGAAVEAGCTLATLRHGDREIEVKAPFAGVVTGVNRSVQSDPTIINRSPYSEGWLCELRPDNAPAGQAESIQKDKTDTWLTREIDRLTTLVSGQMNGAPSMADGGSVVDGCADHVDERTWRAVTEALFR